MNKVAFVSMDVESFYDTGCVKGKKVVVDPKFNCAKEITKFVDFLAKYNAHATFFVTYTAMNMKKSIDIL